MEGVGKGLPARTLNPPFLLKLFELEFCFK